MVPVWDCFSYNKEIKRLSCTKFKANRFSTPCITKWRNSTVHCVNELCYILIISIFNFLIFIHFTNQKLSLAQKLKLIFKFSPIMEQINVPLWTHMGHKGWRKNGKTFTRCYTIVLKFWDESNANFILLYFSSYSSIKMWPLSQKCGEKQ